MKMEKFCIGDSTIYNKIITIILKLLLLSAPLFVNKYVYDFRVNQEAVLKLFTLILIAVSQHYGVFNQTVFHYSASDDQTPLFCENGIAAFVSKV